MDSVRSTFLIVIPFLRGEACASSASPLEPVKHRQSSFSAPSVCDRQGCTVRVAVWKSAAVADRALNRSGRARLKLPPPLEAATHSTERAWPTRSPLPHDRPCRHRAGDGQLLRGCPSPSQPRAGVCGAGERPAPHETKMISQWHRQPQSA